MKANLKCILGLAFVVVLSMGTMLYAGEVITFDPDGSGPMIGVKAITFDWSPGNALAINANPGNGVSLGDSFPILYQANMANVKLNANVVFAQGNGGNYFTAVASYSELVVGYLPGTPSVVVFSPDLSQESFFRIYHNTTGNATDLTGTQFTSGTLILEGSLIADNFASSFESVNNNGGKLDQNGNDDWNGQLTAFGSGSTTLEMNVDFADPNYFPDLLVGYLYALGTYNTNQKYPFDEVNPSKQFFDGTVAYGHLGPSNGVFDPGITHDIIFQSDANGSFTHVGNVPEPTTLLLLGSGLLGLAVLRKRAK